MKGNEKQCSASRTRQLKHQFAEIAKRLNAGDALNYSVSFGVYETAGSNDSDFETILKNAMGPEVCLAGSLSVSINEATALVRSALEYTGDDGSHPNRTYLSSKDHADDVNQLCDLVKSLCASADLLTEIGLKDWHPFYPVFWDFTLLLLIDARAVIVVGSSSD